MLRALRTLAAAAVLLTAAALLATTLAPRLLGYETYVIDGASMEPTIARGSIVISDVVPVADLREGDVITYVPPGRKERITHRITGIRQVGADRVLRTRGDNTPVADPWRFTLDAPRQARMTTAIPWVGWTLIALADPLIRLLALAVPALLIALMMVTSLWRDGGAIVARREHLRREDPA